MSVTNSSKPSLDQTKMKKIFEVFKNPHQKQDWFKGWPTRPPSKILQDACNYSLSQRACTICKPIYTAENAPPTLPGIEQIEIVRYRCFQLKTISVSVEINSPHQTTRTLNRQAGKIRIYNEEILKVGKHANDVIKCINWTIPFPMVFWTCGHSRSINDLELTNTHDSHLRACYSKWIHVRASKQQTSFCCIIPFKHLFEVTRNAFSAALKDWIRAVSHIYIPFRNWF